MFTENEISALIIDPEIEKRTKELKEEFIGKEAPFLEISDHDFLSLILITPSVGIALANGSVSLMEEMALNKKARKYSRGGYFLKQDPVVISMGYLMKHYDIWADIFYQFLNEIIDNLLDKDELLMSNIAREDSTDDEFCIEILKAPFILVRFITSFLSNEEDEDLALERRLAKVEYDRIQEILEKVGLLDIPIVTKHITKFIVK